MCSVDVYLIFSANSDGSDLSLAKNVLFKCLFHASL